MNSKELQNREIFIRVGEFGKRHAADLPAATIAGTLFTELDGITAALDAHAAAEYSHTGGGRQKQAAKADSHDLLETRQLDAIVRNTFHDDATSTEWKRASRPERAKSRPAAEPAKAAAA